MTNHKEHYLEDEDNLVFVEDDPELVFEDDDEKNTQENQDSTQKQATWKIIIVDDDLSVHQATKLALKNLEFDGKYLTFISAFSGEEAKQLIAVNPDVALVFLDVVMETNDAGLKIVKYIREELNNKLVRIILRTGQPGDAPEESVIVDYDINDYKLKVELTRQKLLVTAIATLRAYRDLVIIDSSRQQIASLYATLEIARDNLEELVQIRTQELQEEIEQRKKIEKTLRLTQFSLDRARDAVYFLNGNAQFFYVNEAACKTLGYSKEELLEMTIHQIDPNLSPEVWNSYWQEIKQKQFYSLESIHYTKEGIHVPVEVNLNYLEFDEQEYNCAIARDISERKKIEIQLREANQELQRLAHIDSLTQLANRRSFDEHFNLEWRRMLREQKPLSLILCDVDFFKKYNDFYGHQVGDDCLKNVAQIINESIRRPGDLAARYGGEEFAVILPNTNAEGALHVAETIRNFLEKLQLPHSQSQVSEYVTLSLGVSSIYPTHTLVAEQLIKQADQALYEAKNQGRNRCYLIVNE
jgi:diguanylate cyclase (GGDEF)-like protein/PAS domain S-box-containing protein